MEEIFDPLASTITLKFQLNSREDTERYHLIKSFLQGDQLNGAQSRPLLRRSQPPTATEFPSLGTATGMPERNQRVDEMIGDNLTKPNEFAELQEKVEQLELENFNLVTAANTLRSQILSTRYEV